MLPTFRRFCFIALLTLAAPAGAFELRQNSGQNAVPAMVETVAGRYGLVTAPSAWDLLLPTRVVTTGPKDVAVAATLYARPRSGAGPGALLLTQRNVLPSSSGWGAPAACNGDASRPGVIVYQSPRDVLCGWARRVPIGGSVDAAHLNPFALVALAGEASRFGAAAKNWLWIGLRVSNRNDFLDIQMLLPDDSAVSQENAQKFLADMAKSMDASWLGDSLVAAPPPVAKPAAEPAGGWLSGTLSTSALRTLTFRAATSVKTFMVASLMAGDAATGGAIIAVLNITNTSLYLLNDYLWETRSPLTPPPHDFLRLVDGA